MRNSKGAEFNFYVFITAAETNMANYRDFRNYLSSQSFSTLENNFLSYVKYKNSIRGFDNILDNPKWKVEEESFNRLFQEIYKIIK